MEFEYFDCVEAILQKVRFSEAANMCAGVDLLEKCVMDHGSIYIFGASHAGILSQEMFYRAGGLMLINPIFGKEVSVEASPITLTSDMERLVGYGTALAKHRADFQIGDVLIAHSVSGRNPVTIEVAQAAKDAGASVIALTNLSYSKTVSSRHPSLSLLTLWLITTAISETRQFQLMGCNKKLVRHRPLWAPRF